MRNKGASRFDHFEYIRVLSIIDEEPVCFQFVLVVDDENRENEGDLIMAGSLVTPQAMAFLVRHSTGIVCVSMKGEDLDRLGLPLMVPQKDNSESMKTAFTWTVVCYSDSSSGRSGTENNRSCILSHVSEYVRNQTLGSCVL